MARPGTQTARARGRRGAGGSERTLFGVPERFMRPRVVLIAAVAILVAFGLLMVYSASSVTALSSTGDAAYYLRRQLMFVAAGTVVAVFLAVVDYRTWTGRFLLPIWVVTVALLAFVIVAGTDNDMGATRWIDLGFFDLQPSEFAKITVIFTAASLAQRYFEEASISWEDFLKLLVGGVAVPIVLIVLQPDKGSTLVLGLTIVVMGYLAGLDRRVLAAFLVLGIVGFLALSLKDDYSRQRLLTMLDPWSDPTGAGYQLIQGFYAFGSGGVLGVGVGFSRQKYSYLPMAHNDFIFAIIGEECGLVGTVGMLAGFAVFLWAGLEIARHAPDLAGRLVAAGCTSIVVIQMLLNVCGVLGIFPLSGKPIPFVSYGGSSIMASLMLVGIVLSVSTHSRLPETAHDSVRGTWRVASPDDDGLSLVGEPTPRSARGRDASSGGSRAGFTVVDGGARRGSARQAASRAGTSTRGSSGGSRGSSGAGGSRGSRGGAPRGRVTRDGNGRKRIDLGPSATDRLRGGRGSGRGR